MDENIIVDDVSGFEDLRGTHAITIGNELFSILPIDKKTGVLFIVSDKTKSVVVRVEGTEKE